MGTAVGVGFAADEVFAAAALEEVVLVLAFDVDAVAALVAVEDELPWDEDALVALVLDAGAALAVVEDALVVVGDAPQATSEMDAVALPSSTSIFRRLSESIVNMTFLLRLHLLRTTLCPRGEYVTSPWRSDSTLQP
ncbi:MAG: hypothetical protein M1296_06800 [Chloroflexi bacterium]|nr:hypothetical protein [Chloroflexota bacterium]